MSGDIKPIETRYKGYRFRSRLEARWAVFFDDLELEWSYEDEGFELSDGSWYLPDFKVMTPQGERIWYEIKPNGVRKDSKFDQFKEDLSDEDGTYMNGDRATLLSGDPMHLFDSELLENRARVRMCPRCGFIQEVESYQFDADTLIGARFQCFHCDAETPSGTCDHHDKGVVGTLCRPHKGDLIIDAKQWSKFHKRLLRARIRAREIRFDAKIR